ncbi:MAG: hypothetical protein QOJ11_3007 [Frankiales bacterium]|jgi:hypothetical protein|nr:hypothetical protein [Frankiales bacterium]
MLGRKDYTKDELDHAKAAVAEQLAAYRTFARVATTDFEALYFNNMLLVLDRYFVHRARAVTGKDGNPINEVELLAESLMNNDGILRGNSVLKYAPEQSVVKLKVGDRIRLTADQFDRLSTAFFAEMEAKFL